MKVRIKESFFKDLINYINQRWLRSTTTPWRRLPPCWLQVKILGILMFRCPPSTQLLKCIVLHSLTPCACTYSVAYLCARSSCIWQHHGLCGQGWWGVLGEACRGERTLLLFSVFKLDNFCQVRTQSAPDSWSWVQQGGISSVKNQVCAIHVNF